MNFNPLSIFCKKQQPDPSPEMTEIKTLLLKFMSTVSDELTKVKSDLDTIKAGIQSLNDKIANFKPELSPEDQAALDAIAAESSQLSGQFSSTSSTSASTT